jgi:FKBP-type peptidyl-prolyl cis-trans isomerase
MKRQFFTGVTLLVLTAFFGAVAQSDEQRTEKVIPTSPAGQYAATSASETPKVNMEDVSYCIGLSFGKSVRSQEIAIDLAAFKEGVQAGFERKESKFSNDQIREVMNQFQANLIQKQIVAEKKAAEAALEKEKEFFEENKTKTGVSATESGLQYRVIKNGAGEQPASEDLVTVHYHGTLPDGTVFDSSYERGEPVTFPLNRVISGWNEALQLMKEGDKWQLYIPSHLAYGSQGAGGQIGPNQTLVFEVELIKVQGSATESQASVPGVS